MPFDVYLKMADAIGRIITLLALPHIFQTRPLTLVAFLWETKNPTGGYERKKRESDRK